MLRNVNVSVSVANNGLKRIALRASIACAGTLNFRYKRKSFFRNGSDRNSGNLSSRRQGKDYGEKERS